MKNRRHLTPPMGVPTVRGTHAMRRGGARREVSERVTLTGASGQCEGWALNVSRGGVRVILEQKVELGEEFDITVGDPSRAPLQRRGRVVWVQEEKDGAIVGIEFLGTSGSFRSPVPPGTTH